MNIKPGMPKEVLSGITYILQSYVPELTPALLIEALQEKQPGKDGVMPKRGVVEFPEWMTRQQAAKALGVSLPTLDTYLARGILRRHKIGGSVDGPPGKLVRIAANDVWAMLEN